MNNKIETKAYSDMTVKEQLDFVTNLTDFAQEKLPRLEKLGDAWEAADRKDFETGLRLIGAFGFARDYASQSLFYGDYNRRIARINYYLDRIKKELSKGTALRGANGELLAFVPSQKVARRRGRPTKQEQVQMEAEKANEGKASLEADKAKVIAKLLGIENVVTEVAVRDKTDAEKVAVIKAKEGADADKEENHVVQQADLFSQIGMAIVVKNADGTETVFADGTASSTGSIQNDKNRLPLQLIKMYLSDELIGKVDQVRELRASFASHAERAKILAEQGANPDDVAPYAQEAHDLNDQIEAIYAAVDRELAMVYGRLRDDTAYCDDFKRKFHVEDVEPIKKTLKEYYDKMPETFAQEVESVVRENNPEEIAAKEKAAADKAAADKIIKYLTRKDKRASAKRLETMQKRIEVLKTLIGEEAAAVYQPYVDKCKEEVETDE